MRLEQLFTQEELSLIDSGEYRPGRAVLDAKLDLCAAAEREACAMVCEAVHARHIAEYGDYIGETYAVTCAADIRARGQG